MMNTRLSARFVGSLRVEECVLASSHRERSVDTDIETRRNGVVRNEWGRELGRSMKGLAVKPIYASARQLRTNLLGENNGTRV